MMLALLFAAGLVLVLDGWNYFEAAILSDDQEAIVPFLKAGLRAFAALVVLAASTGPV